MLLSKCLFLSPRNSYPIHEHLLKESGANTLIYDETFKDIATDLDTEGRFDTKVLPSLASLIDTKTQTAHYEYHETWSEAATKPALVNANLEYSSFTF